MDSSVSVIKTLFRRVKDYQDSILALIQDKRGQLKALLFRYPEMLVAWEVAHPEFTVYLSCKVPQSGPLIGSKSKWFAFDIRCKHLIEGFDRVPLVVYFDDVEKTLPSSKLKRWSDQNFDPINAIDFILKRWHDGTLDHYLDRMKAVGSGTTAKVFFSESQDFAEFMDEISDRRYWSLSDYYVYVDVYYTVSRILKNTNEYIKPDEDCMSLLDSVKLPNGDFSIVKNSVFEFPSGPVYRFMIGESDGRVYTYAQLRPYPGTRRDFNWYKKSFTSCKDHARGSADSWEDFTEDNYHEFEVPEDFMEKYLDDSSNSYDEDNKYIDIIMSQALRRVLAYWYLNSCEKKPIYIEVEPSDNVRSYTRHPVDDSKQRVIHKYVSLTEEYHRIVKGQKRQRTESSKDGLHQEDRVIKPFVRLQHYGPNRSFTKSIFVAGFTRKQWVSDAIVVTHVRK